VTPCAQVSGFSARDESSAFIPGWDTPPMVANWSYYKRGWRNGTSTTTDPVWTDLDHTAHMHTHAHMLVPACTHARMHTCKRQSLHAQVWTDLDHVPPSRIASNQLDVGQSAVWASKQILKRRESSVVSSE